MSTRPSAVCSICRTPITQPKDAVIVQGGVAHLTCAEKQRSALK